jgi:REP element-mobilizing transposase RayT
LHTLAVSSSKKTTAKRKCRKEDELYTASKVLLDIYQRKAHGGSLATSRRRTRRPLLNRKPVHLVLRTDFATGSRSLTKNRPLVVTILRKYARRFKVRIYNFAICSNHIHCLIKGKSRRLLQNFFRVVAGQIAQKLLHLHPFTRMEDARLERQRAQKPAHPKNLRTFWSYLAFTRIVGWGKDYRNVTAYITQNTKEANGAPYKKRERFLFGGIFTIDELLANVLSYGRRNVTNGPRPPKDSLNLT